MVEVATGVYPVLDIVFSVGTKGLASSEDDMASTKNMESFSLSTGSNVEKWSPMDQGGWGKTLATAKAVTVSLKGRRGVGDKGSDYAYTVLWKDGLDCSTKCFIEFPDGFSITGNCVLDVKTAPGGDSTNVVVLEFDIIFDGKPTSVPALTTPEGGA